MSKDNNHISTILPWFDTNPCFYGTPLGKKSKFNFMMTGQDVIVNRRNL